MSLIIPANSASATGGYQVANSCRFDGTSAYLSRTQGTPTDIDKYTISVWFKRSALFNGSYQNIIGTDHQSVREAIRFNDDADSLTWDFKNASNTKSNITPNQLFRDVASWYNLVCIFDSANGTANLRRRIFLNGTEITSFAAVTYNAQNEDGNLNKGGQNIVIGIPAAANNFFSGYMSEFVFVDGQALTPDGNFGEFDEDSGIWKPIDVSGLTFGNNGFYLDFEDSGDLGDDESGNGNDFTESNLAATDQSIDTCTNNFAVWNGLQPTNATLTEGNLVGASSASSGHYSGISSIGVSSGKWYFECKQTQESAENEGMIGVIIFYNTVTALLNPVGRGGGWGMQDGNRGFSTDSGGSGSTTDNFHAGWTDDDIIGIALDIDNSRVYYSKGGQWNNSGSWNAANPTTSQTLQNALGDGTYFFMAGDASGSNNCTWSANFGSPAHAISSGNTDGDGYGNFEYAVPSGYYSLNTKNLAEYG